MIFSRSMLYNLSIMLISIPSMPSMAALKADMKSRPARWGAIFVALLLAFDILSVATWMTFPALKIQRTSASTLESFDDSSAKIVNVIEKLKGAGADPFVVTGSKVHRESLSVPGVILALKGDNIQLFEYGSQGAASREAQDFLASYSVNSDRMPWMPIAELHTYGSVLVLYTGNRADISSLLTGTFGAPIGKNS